MPRFSVLKGLKGLRRRLHKSVLRRQPSSQYEPSSKEQKEGENSSQIQTFENIKFLGTKKMDDTKKVLSTIEHLRRSGKESHCIVSIAISPINVQIEQQNPNKVLYDNQVGDLRDICVLPKKPRIFGYVVQDPTSNDHFCFCLKMCKRSGIKGSTLAKAFQSVSTQNKKEQDNTDRQLLSPTPSHYSNMSPRSTVERKQEDIIILAWELVHIAWEAASRYMVTREGDTSSTGSTLSLERRYREERERMQAARDLVCTQVELAFSRISQLIEINDQATPDQDPPSPQNSNSSPVSQHSLKHFSGLLIEYDDSEFVLDYIPETPRYIRT